MQRKSDRPFEVHFHANRIHSINGQWYFLTREGANPGPFESKKLAENELAIFLAKNETGYS